MSDHDLLNLLNELRKSRSFYHFFAIKLVDSILQDHEC